MKKIVFCSMVFSALMPDAVAGTVETYMHSCEKGSEDLMFKLLWV